MAKVTMENCTSSGNKGAGIRVGEGADVQMRNVRIYDNKGGDVVYTGHSADVDFPTDDPVVVPTAKDA